MSNMCLWQAVDKTVLLRAVAISGEVRDVAGTCFQGFLDVTKFPNRFQLRHDACARSLCSRPRPLVKKGHTRS